MTEALFREDAYLTRTEARVIAVGEAGIELDRTVFYAEAGGSRATADACSCRTARPC